MQFYLQRRKLKMAKLALVLGLVAIFLVVESTCQVRFIRPTYRPPPRPKQPIIRRARQAGDDREPLWLYKGDDVNRAPSTGEHPILPSIIDDVKLDPNSRHARSLSTPGRGRVGSNDRRGNSGSRGHDTGPTHPGYNRRNARSVGLPDFVTTPPFNPKPWTGFPMRRNARSVGLPDFVTTPPFNPKPWTGFPKPDRRPRFPIYV